MSGAQGSALQIGRKAARHSALMPLPRVATWTEAFASALAPATPHRSGAIPALCTAGRNVHQVCELNPAALPPEMAHASRHIGVEDVLAVVRNAKSSEIVLSGERYGELLVHTVSVG